MEEEDFIPISALQHWSYCPRQCALIHAEQNFADNVHTARGNAAHRIVDVEGHEKRIGVHMERALPLVCERLGLIGKADTVEFFPDGSAYPVEYKYGARQSRTHDDVQVAAQALCLEEMTGLPVPVGAIYHVSSRRRREVAITRELREIVAEGTEAIRRILQLGKMPSAANDARCAACSLIELCQPRMLAEEAKRLILRANLFSVATPAEDECKRC
jgi:CRISPR-associated exonuclease Cas4